MTLEGEPGIGKTRLLLAAADLASASGFTCVAITADEEIRGPFLVARSLFASSAIRETAAGTPAEAAVSRVVEAISGRDERGFETLSPDAKLLRAFDLAGVAIAALAGIHPLALFIDDVQWADDDTLRLLRYVVRGDADRPIFLFLTIRPDEFASVTEAVNFVADMERMGLVRRLRPGTVQLGRNGGAPEARPRRPGRGRLRDRHARPVRGRAVHRRGAGPDASRSRHPPADRRPVAAGPQRGPARAVGGSDAHRSPRGAPSRPDEGRAR